MQLILKQNEIQKAIADFVSVNTTFKIKDSNVRIVADYDGPYGNDSQIIGFHAEIDLE